MYNCSKIYRRNGAIVVDVVIPDPEQVGLPDVNSEVIIPTIVFIDKKLLPDAQMMLPKLANGNKLTFIERFLSPLITEQDVRTDIEASAVSFAEQQGYIYHDEYFTWYEN